MCARNLSLYSHMPRLYPQNHTRVEWPWTQTLTHSLTHSHRRCRRAGWRWSLSVAVDVPAKRRRIQWAGRNVVFDGQSSFRPWNGRVSIMVRNELCVCLRTIYECSGGVFVERGDGAITRIFRVSSQNNQSIGELGRSRCIWLWLLNGNGRVLAMIIRFCARGGQFAPKPPNNQSTWFASSLHRYL